MIKQISVIGSLLFLISIAGLSCKSTNNSASQKAVYKSIYIDQFRLTYFRQMLLKGYNNSKAVQEIISDDHSGFTEPILTGADYKLIDSLTTVDNEKMKIDSTEGDMRAEGAQGKRPLGFVIDKLKSKWLDSLANERYKRSGVKEFYRF
ncbi:MAG TPA: hypothetical protein VLC98_06140 [Phnomibacter sp.]|nr:hypothetical protein [Phnomibacter sp.]